MKYIFLVAALLVIFAVLVISSMTYQSATCDEVAHHIPAGYSYYKKFDFRLNPSNPPLSRYIMTLPLNFIKLNAPFDDKSWQDADTPVFGRKFIYEYNIGKERLIVFLARLPMVLMGILTGLLVYIIASAYYGKSAGLFALFLFCFFPDAAAHSGLATTDITAACFILFSIYMFVKFIKRPDLKRNLLMAGIALGLAQLSKYTALILYPMFMLFLAVEFISSKKIDYRLLGKVALIFSVSIIIIWSGYGFGMKPFLTQTTQQEQKIEFVKASCSRYLPFWNDKISYDIERILKNTPLPLTRYITGICGVMRHSSEGHYTFFMGKWSDYGSHFYYALAFLIKTPIPVIIFFISAIFVALRKGFRRDEVYLLIPIIFIFSAASFNRLQLGIRYILPIYPLCFVFSSRLVPMLKNGSQRLFVFILSAWLVISNFLVWPHYLSYFNELCGGPNNGWKYFRDSNLDWGQDLPALSKYMADNNIDEIVFRYFGQAEPLAYGVRSRDFRKDEFDVPEKRVYAISAQYLEHAKWTKYYKPTAKAGYSIFIYDFRLK